MKEIVMHPEKHERRPSGFQPAILLFLLPAVFAGGCESLFNSGEGDGAAKAKEDKVAV